MSSPGVTDTSPRSASRSAGLFDQQRVMVAEALSRPLASYYLLLVCGGLLLLVGLIMVQSSSSVYAMVNFDNAYYYFIRQAIFLAIGLPVAVVLSRCGEWGARIPVLRRWLGEDPALATERVLKLVGWVALSASLVLLAAVVFTPLGTERNGNRAWLDLGPIEIQPSEFAKVALVLWSAAVFATRQRSLSRPMRLLVPYLPVSLIVVGLVALEKDIGTMMILGAIVLLQLWFVGAPARIIAGLVGLGAIGISALVVFEVVVQQKLTHVCRVAIWANQMLGTHLTTQGCLISDQPANALLGLATGGWWGVGLGASRQKWGGLYTGAQTDYVFAVLGEEWGLVGSLLVIALFCVLGYAGLRVAARSDSLFRRVAAAGLTGWLLVQASINVLVAMQLLPVAGVPLPFLSYGGSGLMAGLIALGVLLALARQEPAAVAVLTRAPRARQRWTSVVAGGR